MKSRGSLSGKFLQFVYAQAQPVYLREMTEIWRAWVSFYTWSSTLQEEISRFSFEIFQFILMQSKKKAELSSFSIFNLRDGLKDFPREKLWFDSGKKKMKNKTGSQ